ncbi:MAG: ankyrin repeat domain-containing protein [Candidatus Jidaibacter sp.]|nr:ankyrin repeat domain-containing protein [Candidatus Jidaibacter sp.]
MSNAVQGKTKASEIFSILESSAPTGGKKFLTEIRDNPELLKQCDENKNTLLHKVIVKDNALELLTKIEGEKQRSSAKDLPRLLEYEIIKGNIDAKNNMGNTALYLAVVRCSYNIAICLIENGADVKVINRDILTPLHGLVKCYSNFNKNAKKCVEALINKGAEINARDKNGLTPLHLAIKRHDTRITEFLLAKGADPNVQNNEGNTPLHYATRLSISEGCETMVELLLKYGAACTIKNNNHKMPYAIAEEFFESTDPTKKSLGKVLLQQFNEHARKKMYKTVLACTALVVGALTIYYRKDITPIIKDYCSIIAKEIKNQLNKIEALNGLFK